MKILKILQSAWKEPAPVFGGALLGASFGSITWAVIGAILGAVLVYMSNK